MPCGVLTRIRESEIHLRRRPIKHQSVSFQNLSPSNDSVKFATMLVLHSQLLRDIQEDLDAVAIFSNAPTRILAQ